MNSSGEKDLYVFFPSTLESPWPTCRACMDVVFSKQCPDLLTLSSPPDFNSTPFSASAEAGFLFNCSSVFASCHPRNRPPPPPSSVFTWSSLHKAVVCSRSAAETAPVLHGGRSRSCRDSFNVEAVLIRFKFHLFIRGGIQPARLRYRLDFPASPLDFWTLPGSIFPPTPHSPIFRRSL